MKTLQAFSYFIFALLIFQQPPALAREWRNAYISFEIPDRWKCILEQTEWVCRSDDPKESKESIIILTAKEVGPIDTMPMYESHLQNAIALKLPSGNIIFSKPYKKPQQVQIKSQLWLDGFHLESEVQNYFTRYLATIKDRIAVLVTFSAHKDDYARYSADFARAIQSLKVIAAKNLTSNNSDGVRGSSGSLFPREQLLLPNEPFSENVPQRKKDKTLFFVLALLLASVGIYFLYRSQKK
ncbi:MAG: hypothetical protein AABY64_08070 [Bdellovibrionota bacterium]